MLNPMNADEARDYIRTQLIQSHPSRAKNTDEYYATLANEVADRLVDEVTVRKMARVCLAASHKPSIRLGALWQFLSASLCRWRGGRTY